MKERMPPPEYVAARAFPRAMGVMAGNDEDGSVWCGLCAWTLPPGSVTTNETAEHRVQTHLIDAHGVRAAARYDHTLNKQVLIL